MNYFSHSQVINKHTVSSRGGIVASQHRRAAEIGAAVLDAGGDAVDAAVATSFALGVVEPWMSGIGGGGAMVLWRAGEKKPITCNFGLRSPRDLLIEDFKVNSDIRQNDLFGWKSVAGDINLRGPKSIAVPGLAAGMELIHSNYGRLPWNEVVSPSVAEAKSGMGVDWYSSLLISSVARTLSVDKDAANLFLDDGKWPIIGGWARENTRRLNQSALADTLEMIGRHGCHELYCGDVSNSLVKDIRDKGGYLSSTDLKEYKANLAAPLIFKYRNACIYATPGLTGGPTLSNALNHLQENWQAKDAKPGANDYLKYAEAIRHAYKDRLNFMGDSDAPNAPACTSHFSIVDRQGNMCSVTQTLLSVFGSQVVSPSTGILLNNGIMWFDPEQGLPNSLSPDKACLMNVCPIVGESSDGEMFAIGASGGRKIVSAVTQLLSFMLDYNMTLGEAFREKRIDASDLNQVILDSSLSADVILKLKSQFNCNIGPRTFFPYLFGCPAGVLRRGGLNMGCTEITSPWGDCVGQIERHPLNDFR